MDLCRAILLAVEARDPSTPRTTPLNVPDYDNDTVLYHLELLNDAGLVKVCDFSSMNKRDIRVERLTWDGHEFLDASRDQTRWATAKQRLGNGFNNATFGVLQAVLNKLVLNEIGL